MKKQAFNPYLPSWEYIPDGEPLGSIPVEFTNVWEDYTAEVKIPDGTQAVYFKYKGSGTADLLSFELI